MNEKGKLFLFAFFFDFDDFDVLVNARRFVEGKVALYHAHHPLKGGQVLGVVQVQKVEHVKRR